VAAFFAVILVVAGGGRAVGHGVCLSVIASLQL
jgi:hypothetical protein